MNYFAIEVTKGIRVYKNGNWEPYEYEPQDAYYPVVKETNGIIMIGYSSGVYAEPAANGGPGFHLALQAKDMAGALGGTAENIFVGAGTNGNGIYRYNGNNFVLTNQTLGTWYSIETLGDEVFFGAGGTHVSGNFGVKRWDNASSSVVDTNLDNGIFTVVEYNGKMFASGYAGMYRWNGNNFDHIYDPIGKLKVTGGKLYLVSGNQVFLYNNTTGVFDDFYESDADSFVEIEEHDGVLYLFGGKGIYVYDTMKKESNLINSELTGMSVVSSSSFGLFISRINARQGIYKMVPQYD